MASISLKKDTFVVRVFLNGKQEKIYTGLKEERAADRLAKKIQALADARKNSLTAIEAGLADWVKKLETENSKVYQKLVSLGLLDQKARPVTVADICRHYVKRSEKKSERTQKHYDSTAKRVMEYFGPNKPVAEITTDDAYSFENWFRTAPLNKRGKKAKPYDFKTANRELKNVKSVFLYAHKLGIIQFNPFAVIRIEKDGNSDNKTYVPVKTVMEVIEAETTPLKWKVILALGRFAGCRGACDLCLLKWDDVIFSDDGKQGKITLKGKKRPGTIPMAPVLENLLREWQGEAILQEIDSQKVFPDVTEETNAWTMTKKSIERAGKEVWRNPWYSLRDSFCIDVMDMGFDPKTYSQLCRHSVQTGLEYYQKYTEHRERNAGERMAKSPLWCDLGSAGATFGADSLLESGETLAEYRSFDDFLRGLKQGLLGVLKRGLQGGAFTALDVQRIKEEIDYTLENTALNEL